MDGLPFEPVSFRRPFRPLVILTLAVLVLAFPAIAFGAGLRFFFADGYWMNAAALEWVWTLLFAFGLWAWLYVLWTMLKMFARHWAPLAVVEGDGIALPHMRPAFVPWTDVLAVEQAKVGAWINLRLKLRQPDCHLSAWQRRWQWPYGDSIMVRVAMNAANLPTPLFKAARAAHMHLGRPS